MENDVAYKQVSTAVKYNRGVYKELTYNDLKYLKYEQDDDKLYLKAYSALKIIEGLTLLKNDNY